MFLHRFTLATLGVTFVLLILGSFVHASASSLACPDWPLCYGQVFPNMVGGVAVEHSHRLLASAVGLMTIVIAVASWRRREVRALGIAALVVVLLQGVLGGITVMLRLPAIVSTAHLGTSMVFFAILVAIAVKTQTGAARSPSGAAGGWALGAVVAVYVQMIVGALVRHTDAGLACGVDPVLCHGDGGAAVLQVVHRVMGVIATLVVAYAALRQWRAGMRWLPVAMVVAVIGQMALGVLSVTTELGYGLVTAHTGGAAVLFASTFAAWMVGRRAPLALEPPPRETSEMVQVAA